MPRSNPTSSAADMVITSNTTVHVRTDQSITQLMQDNVSNTPPEKVVYEDTLMKKTATYGAAHRDFLRMAYSFRHKYGMQSGNVVAFISASCIDYVIAAHAVWAAGGVLSAVNHSSTAKEIAYAINLVQPDFLIVQGALIEHAKQALALVPNMKTCPIFTLVTRIPGIPFIPEDFLNHNKEVDRSTFALDGKDARNICACIVLSSGTTGSPKGVMMSHYGLVSICRQLRAHNPSNWRGSQREVFFPLMQDRKATLARLVPTVSLMLAESSIVLKYSFPALEYFSCSAAPLKAAVATRLRRRFPSVALCQTYGCSELSGAIAQSGVRDKDVPLVAGGRLIANIQLRFIDEQGNDVQPPKPGEICIKSASIMMGYKDNEVATSESFLKPGWYKTGDIGYLDSNGYLIIVDRLKEVIKYKGFQVNPGEIEELVLQHPSVEDAAVAAVWDDTQATELPRAYAALRGGFAQHDTRRVAKEIRQLVDSKVSGYKKLRGGVVFLEKLPRNPTGKILRRLLPKEAEPAEGSTAKL